MRSGAWVRALLCCGLACQVLPAQSNASDDAGDDAPSARVQVVPALRGDLTVTVTTENMPGVALDALRRAALPCDWRLRQKADEFLDGVCRKYLASDGALAHGTLALAPLVTALHNAGAQGVRLELNDFGRPLAQAPQGWAARPHAPKTPFGSLKSVSYLFSSNSDNGLPHPFEVRLGTAWSPARLGIPFGFSLLGPALLAFWLRRRAERKGAVDSASVWVHWILTGTWLYWISAVSVADIAAFAVHLQLDSMVLTFLVGSLVFCVPPLIATASCIAILTRMPAESGERQDTPGLVRRSVAREATLLVPFGMFLVGTGMFEQDWQISIASWPAAYFTYRILSWYVGRGSANRVEILTRGPLMEIAHVIARRASVALGGIYIINNRSRQEVNAFAGSGRILAMTRGLVEHLTCRELVAVIGHEVAHMRAKHVGIRIAAFWGYMLVVGPLAARFIERAHLPQWLLALPILPLAYILATAFLSRNHEFTADSQAAELTQDAEGMIAALARLRKMTRTPVDWGGMQGSILSHPSMRDRVLALARRFSVPEDRALAILRDPDLLTTGTAPEALHFTLPAECTGPDLVFTSSAKAANSMWTRWGGKLALALIALAAGEFALLVWPRPPHVRLGLACVVPLVGWLYLGFGRWLDRGFMRHLHRRLRRRMGPMADGGIFAGLLPGDRVTAVEGFYAWDIGFLYFTPDWLTYRGERTVFSLPRSGIKNISIAKGPLAWNPAYAVTVNCEEGSLSLLTPDRGVRRRQARWLQQRLNAWSRGELMENFSAVSPGPPPGRELFVGPSGYLRGWRAISSHAVHAFLLCVGLVILMPFSLVGWAPAVAFVPFVAPLAYLFAVSPTFFRGKPAPVTVAPIAHAAAAAQQTATPAEEPHTYV